MLPFLAAFALLGLSACGDDKHRITYEGPGVCNPADGKCDYSAVETRTECHGTTFCSDGACIYDDWDTICETSLCDQPEDFCNGDTAVTYSGDGICDEHANETCDFSEVETLTDCTETEEICHDGACAPEDTDL